MKLHEIKLNTPLTDGRKNVVGFVSLIDYPNSKVYIIEKGKPGVLGTKQGIEIELNNIETACAEGEKPGVYDEDQLWAWRHYERTH